MTETAVAVRPHEPELTPFQVIERVVASGDLSKMDPQARIAFYWRTCESLGLNPLTRPFEFITLSGKLTMYAKRDAADQLRKIHRVSIDRIEHDVADDILTVTAYGHTPDGRTDSDIGSVNLKGLSGDARANATKKAVTQAKRRLTLSLVGLGFLDESEIEGGGPAVDPETGELVEPQAKPTLLEAVTRQRERMAATAESAASAPGTSPAAATTAEDDSEATTGDPAAPGPSEAVEASFIAVDAAATPEIGPMTLAELSAWLRENRIAGDYAGQVAKEMWPDTKTAADLTDEQRGQLARELAGPDA